MALFSNWDILFLSTPLYDWMGDLEESMLWGYKPTRTQRILFNLANRLFK